MEEQVGGRGDGVALVLCASANFFEGVQLGGTRSGGAEKTGPSFRAEGGNAGEAAFDAAEVDGAEDAVEVGKHVADGGITRVVGFDGCDEKDRRAGERGEDGLRDGRLVFFSCGWHVWVLWRVK